MSEVCWVMRWEGATQYILLSCPGWPENTAITFCQAFFPQEKKKSMGKRQGGVNMTEPQHD